MIESGFMGTVCSKNSLIDDLFDISGYTGSYHFQKISGLWVYFSDYGYTFEKFLRIYRWYYYDLNGTTPYLGNSSDAPPPGVSSTGDAIL